MYTHINTYMYIYINHHHPAPFLGSIYPPSHLCQADRPAPSEAGEVTDAMAVLYSWLTQELKMEVFINGAIQNSWFIMENPIKTDDWGVPLFQETTK